MRFHSPVKVRIQRKTLKLGSPSPESVEVPHEGTELLSIQTRHPPHAHSLSSVGDFLPPVVASLLA